MTVATGSHNQTGHLGRRIREIRSWRGLTLRACAELAGLSESHLSRVERGERTVERRVTLEAIAAALRVAPSELGAPVWEVVSPRDATAHAGVVMVESALDVTDLGSDPGVPVRDWPAISADVDLLAERTSVHSDYDTIADMAPRLILELHGAYVRHPQQRPHVLANLIVCLNAACWFGKRLGARGLPQLAARLAERSADELDVPEWRGFATWLRGGAAGELSRAQHYQRTVTMIDELSVRSDDNNVTQMVGMLHLSAALACAAQDDRVTAETHLLEASEFADRMDETTVSFAQLWFGTPNVGVWRTSLATEFGDGPRVAEIASKVAVGAIPSLSRQAEFHADLGRALLQDRATAERGLLALLHAERLAPQRVRNDVFVREAVADRLRAARRDAGGRELRGLAYRLGMSA